MPFTSTGRSFTYHDWTNAVGDQSRWALADDLHTDPNPKPVMLFCHGSGSLFDQFSASPAWTPMRDRLIENGWVYVEALGLSATHWGHREAVESYALTLHEAAAQHPLGPVTLYGTSMGGTVSSSLATQVSYGMTEHVAGLILSAPVQSMLQYGLVDGGFWNMIPWYGDPRVDEPAFIAATEPQDPLRFPAEDYAGLPVLWLAGTHDTAVPVEPHARAQYDRVKAFAHPASEIRVLGGGTHGGPLGQHIMVDPWWDFLRRTQGLLPDAVALGFSDDDAVTDQTALHYPPPWKAAAPLTTPAPSCPT
jgi:pimeloyl-ACP methyl ester carboxylesterase